MRHTKSVAASMIIVMMFLSSCSIIKPANTRTDAPPTDYKTTVTEGTKTADPTSPKTIETSEPTSPRTTETTDPTKGGETSEPTIPPTTDDPTPSRTDGKKTVLLDAGHGFIDGGASNPYSEGILEKDIALAAVLEIKRALEARGINVVLTHDGNTYMHESIIAEKCREYGISYDPNHSQWYEDGRNFRAYERAIYACVVDHEVGLDLFVSFHADSMPGYENVSGTVIYYCTETDYNKDVVRAVITAENTLKKAFPSRRVRSEGFSWADGYAITKYPTCPSLLVEMGYLTNEADANALCDPAWRAEYAEAMANAIYSYLR